MANPAVSLWEHRHALARLHERGIAQVDEAALFRMIEQMREIAGTASKTTKRMRRDTERRSTAAAEAKQRAKNPAPLLPPETTDEQTPDTEPACGTGRPFRSDRAVVTMPDYESTRLVPPAPDVCGTGPAAGGRAGGTDPGGPVDRLPAGGGGAGPAGNPVALAGQAAHAEPVAGRADEQRQVDDRGKVPPGAPAGVRAGPGAHPGVVRADAFRAFRAALLRRAAGRAGRAAATPAAVGRRGADRR